MRKRSDAEKKFIHQETVTVAPESTPVPEVFTTPKVRKSNGKSVNDLNGAYEQVQQLKQIESLIHRVSSLSNGPLFGMNARYEGEDIVSNSFEYPKPSLAKELASQLIEDAKKNLQAEMIKELQKLFVQERDRLLADYGYEYETTEQSPVQLGTVANTDLSNIVIKADSLRIYGSDFSKVV